MSQVRPYGQLVRVEPPSVGWEPDTTAAEGCYEPAEVACHAVVCYQHEPTLQASQRLQELPELDARCPLGDSVGL